MQESCRIAALTSTAPEQIEMIFYFFFISKLHAHLCRKYSSADCDMCEIQLRTCCGCTLCNPGRLGGSSSSREATLQAAANTNHNGLGRCQELGMCHHTAHRRSERHTLPPSPSVYFSALRSVEKGMQQTLLDTSVYNSCPAPKIE